MVLHRPVELAPDFGKFKPRSTKFLKTPFFVHYMGADDYFRVADKPPTTGERACAGHARYGDVTPVTLRLQGYTGSGAG
jgi:hypothetical protein